MAVALVYVCMNLTCYGSAGVIPLEGDGRVPVPLPDQLELLGRFTTPRPVYIADTSEASLKRAAEKVVQRLPGQWSVETPGSSTGSKISPNGWTTCNGSECGTAFALKNQGSEFGFRTHCGIDSNGNPLNIGLDIRVQIVVEPQ